MTDNIKTLVDRLKKQCAGRERWYVMNAEEDGYIIDFEWQLDADRWMDRYMRENPDFIKRNGYHIVKRMSFTAKDELINEAVSALEAAIARIAELEARLGAQAGEPVYCAECGDSIVDHDPGICGCCYAIKYRDSTPIDSASDTRRFDWTTTGMKQSPDGAWVLASAEPKKGE